MKKFFLALVASLLAVGTYAQEFESYVEVSGNAELQVSPDRFDVQIMINESTTKGKVTVEELEREMISVFSSLGVDCKKSLSIKYASSDYVRRKGALAKRTYILKLEDGELVQKVYDKLGDLDITSVRLLKSYNSQQEKYEAQARNEALLNARATAEDMAAVYDQKIGSCFYMRYNVQHHRYSSFDEDVVMVGYGASNRKETAESISPISFDKQLIKAYVDTKFLLMPNK